MLLDRLGDHAVAAIAGLCKNAGKTTVLCRLLEELAGETVALTSVGRDGERTDLVTGTEKPGIWVSRGTFFATARGLLPSCDVSAEVADVTPWSTPLGEVAVLRALSDGFVQLAGPSAVGQLAPLCRIFRDFGATRVLIDGAAGRRSLAAVEGACAILCVGASLHPSMDVAVAETAHVCSLFSAPLPAGPLAAALAEADGPFSLFAPTGSPLPLEWTAGQPNWAALPREDCVLWAGGGVTSALLRTLARRGSPLTVAVPDATHLLCDRVSTGEFTRRGGRFLLRRAIPIAAVAANPWSAYGNHYHREDFLTALRETIPLPVVDAKEGAP